ncbi:MAG: hypothetical protein NBV67_02385 [Tagaea sp.]|nr:hypothetical protein [Tagaea sp.]
MGGAVPAIVIEKQFEERASPARVKADGADQATRTKELEALRRGLRGRRFLQGDMGELGYLAPLGANPGRS